MIIKKENVPQLMSLYHNLLNTSSLQNRVIYMVVIKSTLQLKRPNSIKKSDLTKKNYLR